MREHCTDTLSAASMPDSLVASATAAEITAECTVFTTVQQLAGYARKFLSSADTLPDAKVRRTHRLSDVTNFDKLVN